MISGWSLFLKLKQSLSDVTDEFEQEAYILLEHGLSKTRAQLLASFHDDVADEQNRLIQTIVQERLSGKPLAYCLKEAYFMRHVYQLNEHVLIPRPETEQLVEVAISFLQQHRHINTIFECGIGSGVISLELAFSFPDKKIKGWDNSKRAYDCAELNRKKHQRLNCEFIYGDFFEGDFELNETTLLISNPPYIPSGDVLRLSPGVKDFEPHSALDGGADGLEYYRRFIHLFDQYSFVLITEIGIHQMEALRSMACHLNVEFFNDYQGIPRIMVVMRKDYTY